MAKGLAYTLKRTDGSRYTPWHLSQIRYGRCTETPYIENELWFVTIPSGDTYRNSGPAEDLHPDHDHTFLVTSDYARPAVFGELRRDVTKWSQIAYKIIPGSWCERYERLWEDVPVYKHQLPNGSIVKYGYCGAQSLEDPTRELWFVAFREASPPDHPSTFVVDKMCTDVEFLDRMGNDHWKWMTICWCRLDDKNEVDWDQLETGTSEGGCIRHPIQFAFDSPYLPFGVDDIRVRIEIYEREVASRFEQYQHKHSGLLNRKQQWKNLDQEERDKLEILWRRQACRKIQDINNAKW